MATMPVVACRLGARALTRATEFQRRRRITTPRCGAMAVELDGRLTAIAVRSPPMTDRHRLTKKYLTASMDNLDAWRLGQCAREAMEGPAGDLIDSGLILRRLLEESGYGVVKLEAPAVEPGAAPSDTPEYRAGIERASRYVLEVIWARGPVGRDSECVKRLVDAFNHVVPAEKSEGQQ